MKTLKPISLVAALVAGLSGPAALADDSKYDVLAKTLMPFVNIFAKKTRSPDRALVFRLRLEKMTGMPPELAGARAEVEVEYPDKLRLSGPLLGQEVIICRNDKELWAAPAAKITALLEAAAAAGKLPPPDPDFNPAKFRLPVSEKQLVFLPALFVVGDRGQSPLDGINCRVLDLELMPELARPLGVKGWAARVWISPQNRPVKLLVARDGWQIAVRIDEIHFSPTLPAATWQPTAEEAPEVLKISPARYGQLMQLIGGKEGK